MKKFIVLFLFLLVGVIAAHTLTISTAAEHSKLRLAKGGLENRYIVVLNPKYVDASNSLASVESSSAYLSGAYGGKVERSFGTVLDGFVTVMSKTAARNMSSDPAVLYVEQDAPIYPTSTQTSATWGLDRVDQRNLPLNSEYNYNTDASNVHVFILDSGIRSTHAEFGGRATKDFDAVGDGQNGNDCMGHGTHVAGTIGASTWGVAKNAQLHAVRVLPCAGSGLVSHLISGLTYVADETQFRPAVANISITASGGSNALDTAVQNTINAGVTVVVSAGNSNLDGCNFSPGRGANTITVGASNSDDTKAGYSNFGPCIDVWAPGTGITSVSNANDTDARVMSGTSMASPHVAGIAALYLAANPTASPATVAQAILSTASTNKVIGLDASSPNTLAYSLLGAQAPPPTPPGRVTIKKRANTRVESIRNSAFQYNAVNLAASSFTLQPNNQFEDVGVTQFGSANMVVVTEAPVYGWLLSSISCVETSTGTPNQVNSTVDLANRKANIIVEPGEQVECTFTSDELAPSAANAAVSGRVVTENGRGVRGVRITVIDIDSGAAYVATSNSFGYYKVEGLQVGKLFAMTASRAKSGVIENPSRTFSLTQDLYDANFVVRRW